MRILSIQHALPSRRVSNDELIERALAHPDNQAPPEERAALGLALERYLDHSGAISRYHRATGERALDFGVAAGEGALASANLTKDDIDLLIYVGVARGFIEPATANVFQAALGLSRATCFDILDACASWLRAFDVARHFLRQKSCRRIMILNCEFNFAEHVRFDFRSEEDLHFLGAGLTVGEAATATILEDGGDDGDYYATFRTSGAHHDLCQIPLPAASQFDANGRGNGHPAVRFYAYARRLHRAAIGQLAQQYRCDARLKSFSPDIVFGHSPSVPAGQKALRLLGLETALWVDPFPHYGNTVSASVPLAMSLAAADGTLRRGMGVLLIVPSAGVTTAFCRFTY